MRLLSGLCALALAAAWQPLQAAQAVRPGIIDVHVHHNGDPSFLRKLLDRLVAVNGAAFIITPPADLAGVKRFIDRAPGRLYGMGEIRLDDPTAIELVDRFHAAGFRALGEFSKPLRNYDDRGYWHLYARAEEYRMILLFHTGVVSRLDPRTPEDASVDRMRVTTLDAIARRFPQLTIIGAHLGNPEYAYAAEIGRWNPNLFFDVSGSTLLKTQADYTFFRSVFWWTGLVSPHTPKTAASAFEKLVFGSDAANGDVGEFDRARERYQNMLNACGVAPVSQANIFAGTMRRLLSAR